jgi:hypothetical protein
MASASPAELLSKARSVHDKRPFRAAVLFTLIHYLCLIAMLTSLVIVLLDPARAPVTPLIASAAAALVSWVIAFIRRRSARCPLCKGSPLFDSGAAKHSKAYRLRPLNYGTTAVLGILFVNRFRCMYCGTPYDLLKRSSSQRHPR